MNKLEHKIWNWIKLSALTFPLFVFVACNDNDDITAVPKNMLISFFIICISVFYSNIILRRILKWMYCANFAQTFKMSQYVPNSLRIQSVVTIHR